MEDILHPSSQSGRPQTSGGVGRPFADIVLMRAVVYTADRRQPWAEAVVVKDGKIVYVGSSDGAATWIGPKTEVFELTGKTVLPGFRDAHIHPLAGSFNLLECRLTGPVDRSAYLARIAAYAEANKDQSFIRGGGWLSDAFPPGGPTRQELDAVVADRPVFLKSMDGHSAWVNTLALQAAGIDRNTPDPPGGLIERAATTGDAAGTLREWAAMALVESRLPPPTPKDLSIAGWAFMQMAARLGVVSVHEAMAKREELAAYREFDVKNELTLRVQAALLCEPEKGMAQVDDLKAMRREYQGHLLLPRTVKIFLDGVVEGHTAWLLAPYADRPGFCGERLWDPDVLTPMVAALAEADFQLHFHAVGDGACRMALDACAGIKDRSDARPMIAHCDLIDPEDIPRFRSCGAIANFQPAWFYQEKNFAQTTLPFLGADRAGRLYLMNTLIKTGAVVACGSDWPFSGELNTFNPLDAIQVSVTRRGLDADAAPAYTPEEGVELAALIDSHTIHSAFADFQEHLTGSLTVGKSADLIVLDRNLFAIPPAEISRTRVLLTIFEGRPVFRDPALAG
ncbi:MAG: amidohydrolase [Deltaproteobacteria bacterium]|nr:amidohydrolase [Deltaproteobacteria bacterium]